MSNHISQWPPQPLSPCPALPAEPFWQPAKPSLCLAETQGEGESVCVYVSVCECVCAQQWEQGWALARAGYLCSLVHLPLLAEPTLGFRGRAGCTKGQDT